MLEIIIISIVQGITEFIPVSSSSHLIIVSKLFNYSSSILLDVSVHIGSFIAVIIYFRKDLVDFFKEKKIVHFIHYCIITSNFNWLHFN